MVQIKSPILVWVRQVCRVVSHWGCIFLAQILKVQKIKWNGTVHNRWRCSRSIFVLTPSEYIVSLRTLQYMFWTVFQWTLQNMICVELNPKVTICFALGFRLIHSSGVKEVCTFLLNLHYTALEWCFHIMSWKLDNVVW